MAVELLLDLAVIIIAGTLLAYIARFLKQPLLIAYIIAGIIIGPIGLHLISDYATISSLAELGVAFLLFAVGMELDLNKLLEFKKVIFVGGALQIAITVFLVALIMVFAGLRLIESFYLGFILAFSSTVIVVKILSSTNRLNSLEGKLTIGYLIVQDIAAVLVLPLLAEPQAIASIALFIDFAWRIIALFALAIIVSKLVLPKIMSYSAKSQEIFYLSTLSSCFAFIYLANFFNFSIAVGGFIGGLALSRLPFNAEAQANIRYIRDLFATIFFVSLGMQFSFFSTAGLPLVALMIAVVFVLNPLVVFLINLAAGFGARTSLFVGLTLAQASEFSFIIASQGLKLGQMTVQTFQIALFVILVSIIATPYMIGSSDWLFKVLYPHIIKLVPKESREYFQRRLKKIQRFPSKEETKNHVVVAGCGVFGSEIVENLYKSNTVVVLDHDPEVLQKFSAKGIPAVYSERYDETVWKKIGLENARILIVTIPDPGTTANIIAKAKKINKGIIVLARAHYFSEALEYYDKGADYVIMPQVLGGNYCVKVICEYLETGKLDQAKHLNEEFLSYLKDKAREEHAFAA